MDDLIARHERFVQSWKPEWKSVGAEPKQKLAIVTDMDSRIDVIRLFDLSIGDAIIIRNAGATVTEDVLRSLTLAVHKLGVKKILIMGSTNNPLEKLDFQKLDVEIRKKVDKDIESIVGVPIAPWLKVFEDIEDNVVEQVSHLKRNPLFRGVEIKGAIYKVDSGKVEVI
jgi:carbonic anhydrase